MVDVKALKLEMMRKGYTNESLAAELGISSRTLTNRFKEKEFGSSEIKVMISILDLKDPLSIFFADKVT